MSSGFPTRSDTSRDIQIHKIDGGLKLRIMKEERFYCLYSESKGADQLRGSAPLLSYVHVCKKQGFL